MDLKTKVGKVDEMLNTIATHDDEELSAVNVALHHIKKRVDDYLQETNKRRNVSADNLIESLGAIQN